MQIKELGIDELEIAAEIAAATWPSAYKDVISSEQIQYMLAKMYDLETLKQQKNAGHSFFVAIENDQHVGFIAVQPKHPIAEQLKIHKLYIHPSFQGHGVGKVLFSKALEVARENQLTRIVLNVNKRNKAVDFYKHIGFVIDQEVILEIGNGYVMDDFVMGFSLVA
jgi:ribosomal protein S18 acetylase RimI-like enzyme